MRERRRARERDRDREIHTVFAGVKAAVFLEEKISKSWGAPYAALRPYRRQIRKCVRERERERERERQSVCERERERKKGEGRRKNES